VQNFPGEKSFGVRHQVQNKTLILRPLGRFTLRAQRTQATCFRSERNGDDTLCILDAGYKGPCAPHTAFPCASGRPSTPDTSRRTRSARSSRCVQQSQATLPSALLSRLHEHASDRAKRCFPEGSPSPFTGGLRQPSRNRRHYVYSHTPPGNYAPNSTHVPQGLRIQARRAHTLNTALGDRLDKSGGVVLRVNPELEMEHKSLRKAARTSADGAP